MSSKHVSHKLCIYVDALRSFVITRFFGNVSAPKYSSSAGQRCGLLVFYHRSFSGLMLCAICRTLLKLPRMWPGSWRSPTGISQLPFPDPSDVQQSDAMGEGWLRAIWAGVPGVADSGSLRLVHSNAETSFGPSPCVHPSSRQDPTFLLCSSDVLLLFHLSGFSNGLTCKHKEGFALHCLSKGISTAEMAKCL
jgi:hypothetical protein